MEKNIDNQKRFGSLLTDLFWAFDCLWHDLLIAKLSAYWSSIDSLGLVQDWYKPKTKNQNKFSILLMRRNFIRSSRRINFRASFIKHHFMWFFFFIMGDVDFSSYADDNTSYTIENNMEFRCSNRLSYLSNHAFNLHSDPTFYSCCLNFKFHSVFILAILSFTTFVLVKILHR